MSNDPQTLAPAQDQAAPVLSECAPIGVDKMVREILPAKRLFGFESEAIDIDWHYRADRRRKALAQQGR